PSVKGVPDEIYHMLHHSYVGILKMRRSIESADAHIDASEKAIFESIALLKRVRGGAFETLGPLGRSTLQARQAAYPVSGGTMAKLTMEEIDAMIEQSSKEYSRKQLEQFAKEVVQRPRTSSAGVSSMTEGWLKAPPPDLPKAE